MFERLHQGHIRCAAAVNENTLLTAGDVPVSDPHGDLCYVGTPISVVFTTLHYISAHFRAHWSISNAHTCTSIDGPFPYFVGVSV